MEAFPSQFCRSIRMHWRRRKYYRLDGQSSGKKSLRVTRLGGGPGSGTSRRAWKLRPACRVRLARLLSPARLLAPVRHLLARLRDAYVDSMLALAGKASGMSGPAGSGTMVARRIPRGKTAKTKAKTEDFERRLILEIYKSMLASQELVLY